MLLTYCQAQQSDLFVFRLWRFGRRLEGQAQQDARLSTQINLSKESTSMGRSECRLLKHDSEGCLQVIMSFASESLHHRLLRQCISVRSQYNRQKYEDFPQPVEEQ